MSTHDRDRDRDTRADGGLGGAGARRDRRRLPLLRRLPDDAVHRGARALRAAAARRGRRVHQRRVRARSGRHGVGRARRPARAPRPARPARASRSCRSRSRRSRSPSCRSSSSTWRAASRTTTRRRAAAVTATTATSCSRRRTSARASSTCSSRSTSPTSGATPCSSTATTSSRTRRRRSRSSRSRSPSCPPKDWAVDGSLSGSGGSRSGHAARRRARSASPRSARRARRSTSRRRSRSWNARCASRPGFLDDAETVIVAFGSPAKFVKYAISQLRAAGHRIGYVRPITLWPFPYETVADAASGPNVRRVGSFELSRRPDGRRRAHRRRRAARRSTFIGGVSTDSSGFGVGRILDVEVIARTDPRAARRPRAAARSPATSQQLRTAASPGGARHDDHRHRSARARHVDAPAGARMVEALKPDLLLTQEHHMCPGCGEPLAVRQFLETIRSSTSVDARDRRRRHRLLHVVLRHDGRRPRAGAARPRAVGRDRREAHAPRRARVHAAGRRRHGERGPAGGAPHRGARRERHVHPVEQRRVRRDRRPHDRDDA